MKLLQLFIIGLGISVGFLDGAVNVAFPAIAANFNVGKQDIIWLVVCFVLTNASLVLCFGSVGDARGYRFVLRFGMVWSVIALIADSLAPTYEFLLFARILQGVGAAAAMSCGLALARGLYDESQRGRVIGYYMIMIAFAGALGPFIGGWMLGWLGWSGVYWFRVPIAALALAGTFLLPPDIGKDQAGRDYWSATAATVALAVVLFLSQWSLTGWIVVFAMGAVLTTGITSFTRLLGRSRRIFEEMGSVGYTMLDGINLRIVVINLAAFTVMLLAPFYLKEWRNLSDVSAGTVLFFYPFGFAAAALLSRSIGNRIAASNQAQFGTLLVILGLYTVGVWDEESTVPVMGLSLLSVGLGLGLFHFAYAHIVTGAFPPAAAGVAGSLIELARTAGMILAVSSIFWLFELFEITGVGGPDRFLSSFQSTYQSFALLALVVFAITSIASLWRRFRGANS